MRRTADGDPEVSVSDQIDRVQHVRKPKPLKATTLANSSAGKSKRRRASGRGAPRVLASVRSSTRYLITGKRQKVHMKSKKRLNPRKLLTATAGLAAVSYMGTTACGQSTSGNLMAPDFDGSGGEGATSATTGEDGSGGYNYSSGNLVAPYYPECEVAQGGAGGEGGDGSVECDDLPR